MRISSPVPDKPRGSVLIFSVVILAILALLTTAFLIVTRHAIAASKSSLASMQIDGILVASTQRVTNFLGSKYHGFYTETPHGVVGLNPTNQGLELVDSQEFLNKGAATNAAINMFVHDETFDIAGSIQNPSYALLSSFRTNPAYSAPADILSFQGLYPSAKNAPYYTQAPLRISSNGIDAASGYFVRAGMVEFFNGVTSNFRKQLGASGTVRGRHFVWVRDLDANFYVVPARWGLRAPGTAIGAYGPAEQQMAKNILEYLRTTPNSEMSGVMHAGDPAFIAGLAKNTTFDSISSFSLQFPAYENDPNYAWWRADLENYFTPYLDIGIRPDKTLKQDASGNYYPQFKESPAAININTAPEEVIQAMLSQIPCWDPVNKTDTIFQNYRPANVNPIPPNVQSPTLAELIAKRIVAKRPFLCRMDFEDFVASLLPADPNNLNNTGTPFGAIKYAMQKRYEPNAKPELRLCEFMEIPGLPEGNFPDGRANPYVGSNTKLRQLQRFEFFISDLKNPGDPASGLLIPTRQDCTLNVRTFNNLLNSLTSSPGPSFKVKDLLMRPGDTGAQNTAVIMRFNAGDAYSPTVIRLGGDDTFDTATQEVRAGPNGLCETGIFGYSYYSYDSVATKDYKPIRFKPVTPQFDEIFCSLPQNVGKFVYGITPDLAPTDPQFKNYLLGDLAMWSCVGDGVLSGYYEMWFNFNDAMVMELGEKGDPTDPLVDDTKHGMEVLPTLQGQPLISGINAIGTPTTDTQETPLHETADEYTIIVTPGISGTLETNPNTVPQPFSAANGPTPAGDDKVVKAIRLSKNFPTTDPDPNSNDDYYPFIANDGYEYIISTDGVPLKTVPAPPDPANPDPLDVDKLVDIIVDGGNGTVDTSTQNDDRRMPDPVADHSEIGFNLINESFCWGPVRAAQRSIDQPYNPDQVPTAVTTRDDVAWSPQICFRSRFFGYYALAQGLSSQTKRVDEVSGAVAMGSNGPIAYKVVLAPGEQNKDFGPNPTNDPAGPVWDLKSLIMPGALVSVAHSTGLLTPRYEVYSIDAVSSVGNTQASFTLTAPLRAPITSGDRIAIYHAKVTGERRIESTYDAFLDETLWSRTPLTDKRALGDP